MKYQFRKRLRCADGENYGVSFGIVYFYFPLAEIFVQGI
jgi:hypothetical protein